MTRLNENIPLTRLNENSPTDTTNRFSEDEKKDIPENPDTKPSSSDYSLKNHC